MASTDRPPISNPKPFSISFPEDEIVRLKSRLEDARLPPPLLSEDADQQAPSLRPSVKWLDGMRKEWIEMDIRAMEEDLNRYPHFTTSIDWCKQLHYVHVRSEEPNAIPLILVHGWPGTFHEFHHVIPYLAAPSSNGFPKAQAFDLVIPSLPGFLFSHPPPSRSRGVGDVRGYARILDALMRGLGYERYAAQGGDWGSVVARCLGALRSEKDGTGCRAVHLNFCPTKPSSTLSGLASLLPTSVLSTLSTYLLSKDVQAAISSSLAYEDNMAYYFIQRTRPSQLGVGLLDSPIGLLAYVGWFYQRDLFRSSNDPVKNPDATFTPKALLQTLTLFHLTQSIHASFLPYTNNDSFINLIGDGELHIDVPLALSQFPNEIISAPRAWAARTGKLVWYAHAPQGGHFAALEQPRIFAAHLQDAFRRPGLVHAARSSTSSSEGLVKERWTTQGLWDEVLVQTGQKPTTSRL